MRNVDKLILEVCIVRTPGPTFDQLREIVAENGEAFRSLNSSLSKRMISFINLGLIVRDNSGGDRGFLPTYSTTSLGSTVLTSKV